MKYYLIGEREGKKVMVLSSPHRELLEDLKRVLLSRGLMAKFEVIEGLEFKSLNIDLNSKIRG